MYNVVLKAKGVGMRILEQRYELQSLPEKVNELPTEEIKLEWVWFVAKGVS